MSIAPRHSEEKMEEVPSKKQRRDCPYLDTIDRSILDFDFEKICSVTLSDFNIYACLVCGAYFQGRGIQTPAYVHCLESDHHVFINLRTEKIYCLPQDYEVIDSTLDDIKYLLNPTFTAAQVEKLDHNLTLTRCLIGGADYLPGYVGLNNLKSTDYINVVLQALAHIPPLRNFFLIQDNYFNCSSPLVQHFGEILRKMWNPRNFKGQVSPHELLQAVQTSSSKRFQVGKNADPTDFLQWLLNTLHRDLGGTKKAGSSIIHQVFQGEMMVTSFKPKSVSTSTDPNKQQGDIDAADEEEEEEESTTERLPFLNLTLDLPPLPLFKDELERNIIPQVPLFTLLGKFDGVTEHFLVNGERRRYVVTRLPAYLILVAKRFTKNNWFVEKNNTIINFPLKNLDMRDYCHPSYKDTHTRYDLWSSIRHEGKPGTGTYAIYQKNKVQEQWYEIQDLSVRETIPQLIAVSEAYIQIYERNQ